MDARLQDEGSNSCGPDCIYSVNIRTDAGMLQTRRIIPVP